MKLRSQAVSAAALVLLLLALPAQAQDEGNAVTFDGVGFSFDAELGASVNISRVPGQSPDAESFEEPDARHLAFTLYGRRPEQASVPRVGNGQTVVRVYRTADLALYDLASERIERLQALLDERPDLGAFMEASRSGSFEELPFLPVPNAGQAINARAQYIDTPQVSGIAYVTAFRQDLYPFAADDFWYTFQGFSTDGDRFVAVTSILKAPMFPKRVSVREAQRIASRIPRWVRYLTESTATLNSASPGDFSPPLTSLDALVRSMAFDGTLPSASPPPASPAATAPAPPAASPGSSPDGSPAPSSVPSPEPSPVTSPVG